jgi:hypothetical protein
MRFLLTTCISIALLLCACGGAKKMMKDAKVYEQGGLKQEAFNLYSNAFTTYNKPEARIGMKRVAQQILDEQFQKAQRNCAMQNFEEALSNYDEGFRYQTKFSDLGLTISPGADLAFANCKNNFIENLYNRAEDLAHNGQFQQAKELIYKIQRLDSNNQKAEYLEVLCNILPFYNAGKKAYELELWREAYTNFNEVTKIDVGYLDALKLRDECLIKARITLAILPINNDKIDDAIERSMSANIKKAILDRKNPFVQLVDRENMDELLGEQKINMLGLFDDKTVVQAGKLLGARYILSTEIVSYDTKSTPTRSVDRKAYYGSSTNARKIKYQEFHASRNLDVAFRYQILDAESGLVYASEAIPFNTKDDAVWASFDGDQKEVYPGEWKWQVIASKGDVVYYDQYDQLQKLFDGKHSPLSENDLRTQFMNDVSSKVALSVLEFKP